MDRSSNKTIASLNTNSDGAASAALDVNSGATRISVYLSGISGDHANHVITLQVSPDEGATWFNTSETITGVPGHIDSHICLCTQARVKVTTVEGNSSAVKVFLLAA